MAKRPRREKKAKKPSGTTGPLKVERTAEGVISTHLKIEWPTDQKDIERKILGYFVREFEKVGARFLNIEDGGTKGLDFLLTLPGGRTYLELMEVVLPVAGGKPYRPGAQGHWPVLYADSIFAEVSKKIKKYGHRHAIPVDLLIYVTHEQYRPSEAAIEVLRRYFTEREHPFQYVFFIVPVSEDDTPLRVIFNRDHPFDPVPIEQLASQYWVNLPAAGLEVVTRPRPFAGFAQGKDAMPMTVKDFPNGTVADDGLSVSVDVEMQDGAFQTLVMPYERLDWLVQALMGLAGAAFGQQVKTGPRSQINPIGAAMIAEGFRVLPNGPQGHALVQLTGRSDANEPLGMGSFIVNASQARDLGHQLITVSEELDASGPTQDQG